MIQDFPFALACLPVALFAVTLVGWLLERWLLPLVALSGTAVTFYFCDHSGSLL